MKNVANTETVQKHLNVNYETSVRIMNNCCYGFFRNHFGVEADAMWSLAHPFKYELHDSINYHEVDVEFLKKHIDIFGTQQFYTSPGWGDVKNGKVEWVHNSGYRTVAIQQN